MIHSPKINPFRTLCILLTAMILVLTGCASRLPSGPQPDGTVLIRGKVKKVTTSGDTTTIKIKPPKGEIVSITAGSEAECKKSCPLDGLEKDQPVEIIYRPVAGAKVAVSIRNIAQGSCQ